MGCKHKDTKHFFILILIWM